MSRKEKSEYRRWRTKRWITPIGDIRPVAMVSLVDDGDLKITVEATRTKPRQRWCIAFSGYAGYRNLMEEYRLELWRHLDETGQGCGNTFIVDNSTWIEEISRDEPLLLVHNAGVRHFVIATEDDVVEVLASKDPVVTDLGPVGADVPAAGKSRVLYHPEDLDEIEDLKRRLLASKGDQGSDE